MTAMPTAFLPARAPLPESLFDDADFAAQRRFFAAHPELAATPLRSCPALAAALGIGRLLVKDETARFGLNAFKALGATFAIAMLRERGMIRPGDMLACASEGNHGRAVAHAARRVGCRARVYMAADAAPARVEAIRQEGAEVHLVARTYDEAVRQMAQEARAQGWTIVSDTSWKGYEEIPRLIMLGYTRMLDEEAGDEPAADVVFVPAGVGGLLGAIASWGRWRYGDRRPAIVAVEPAAAACVQASMRHGAPTSVEGPLATAMAGLRCGEMSPIAFRTIASLVDAFVAIEDELAFEAMRRLARPAPGDPAVSCAASGAAALGGLLAALRAPELHDVRAALGLGSRTRALVLVTEGVTDPQMVARVLAGQ